MHGKGANGHWVRFHTADCETLLAEIENLAASTAKRYDTMTPQEKVDALALAHSLSRMRAKILENQQHHT